MEKNDLELLHGAMLDLALEVKRLCDTNDIKYFLIGGSLIGAVRHHGFIPWDDDMDIGIKRKDYEKFLSVCQNQLSNEYHLVYYQNEKDNPNFFAKIKIKGTTYCELMTKNNSQSKEIFIDVFPFDNSPSNNLIAVCYGKSLWFFRRILALKCGIYFHNKNHMKNFANQFIKVLSFFCSKQYLIKKIQRMLTLYDNNETGFIVNACGTYSYMKERVKSELFSDVTTADFENCSFNIPIGYNEYLKHIYGNYMKLPPASERGSRHQVYKIDLGNYQIKNKVVKRDGN